MFESVLGFGPSLSPIPNDTIETAKAICSSGLLSPSNATTEATTDILPTINVGKYYNEKVDRLSALFYRFHVDEALSLSLLFCFFFLGF